MEAQTFLIQLVLILLSARLFGEVAAYFQVPSVIGELVAGIVIGPSILGLVEISNPIHLLANIGEMKKKSRIKSSTFPACQILISPLIENS